MKYTTQEYIAELKRRAQQIAKGKSLAIAAQDTHVKVTQRIFDQGKNSEGKQIGEYDSNDPLYVNPKNSPKKFATKGKEGDAKFKNGKPHKTGYFESYRDYRSAIGRPTQFVNLVLSGRLQSDFRKGLVKISALRHVTGVSSENNDKIEGNEMRFGGIFSLTDEEKENFKNILSFELKQELSGAK